MLLSALFNDIDFKGDIESRLVGNTRTDPTKTLGYLLISNVHDDTHTYLRLRMLVI